MPTDVQHFSQGYKGKKSRPARTRRPRPNGEAAHQGRTPQPGVPTGSRNAPKRTKAERRNAAVAAALKPKPLHAPTKAERRKAAATAALLRRTLGSINGDRLHPKPPTVPTASARTTISKGPSRDELLELAVEKDIIKPQQEAGHLPKHKTLGQDITDQVVKWAPVIAPEVLPALAGVRGAIVAARGVSTGENVVGGYRLLSRALKPIEASTAADRQAILDRLVAKAATKEASGVKAATTRALSRVTRSSARADAAVARRVAGASTRREAVAAGGAPLKLTKAAVAQTLPVVRGHEKAIVENPGKVAKATARAIPGLVTVPVGQAVGVGVTAGRAVSEGAHALGIPGARGYSGKQILAPVKGIAAEQLAFAKQVAKVVTASDSAEVQKAVEDELGLMLPIMLGLGTKAAAEKITRGRITEAVRRIADQTRSKVGKGHGRHNGQTARVFEVSGQRKREAIRAANARTRINRETKARTAKVRQEAGRAKGSEAVRRGVTNRGRVIRRSGDLKIHTGDLVGFAVRHDLPLDKPAAALADVKRIGAGLKPLPKGVTLPADQLSTRDVIGFIEANPHVLADKHLARAVVAYKDQARYARENASTLAPEHSERARYTPAAVARDIPLTQERFPASVRDITRAEPTSGKLAKDVLRRESRSDRTKARRLTRKATKREERARIVDRELAIRERSEPTRAKTNAAARAKGERFAKQATLYRDAAVKAAEEAKRKRHAATAVDPSIESEFVRDVRTRLEAEGSSGQPEYVATRRAAGPGSSGVTAAKVSKFPGRSKFRQGSADAYGMAQEGLASTLRESVARPISRRESYKAMRGFLGENSWHDAQGRSEFTANQIQRLFDTGAVDRRSYVPVPRQDYKRTFSPEEWTAHLSEALKAGEAEALEQGARYMLVRRPAAKEFADQLAGQVFSPRLAKINRATSYLILGTSPAWAAAQIVAEFSQAAAAQPKILNPLFVRKALKEYKALSPKDRWAFDSWVGVTTRELTTPGDLKLDLRTGDMQAASDAWSVMNRTPLGRLIRSIPQSLHNLDQWKGGRIRVLTAAAKIDGDLNARGGTFLRGLRGLYGEIGKVSKELKGKPLSEQMAWVSDHPEWQARYQSYLDDVMGNWSALTHNERTASQFLIFYPFLRMSLRWTFYAFPKRHPIKAAMLYYLGQQNATQLKKLLGRDPSYFTEWAQVPLHLGNGDTKLIPLTRIAPGSNTIVEALGETSDPTLIPLKIAQPALVALIEGATGVSSFTGKQEATSAKEKAVAALGSLLTLAAPARVAEEHLVPKGQKPTEQALPLLGPLFGSTERQESLDKLFTKLEGKGTAARAARTSAAPFLPQRAPYVRDLTQLRAILGTLSDNSSSKRKEIETAWAYQHKGGNRAQIDKTLTRMETAYERASKALDRLFVKYRIPHVAEEEAGAERYDEIHYHSAPKAGTSIGGLPISPAPGKAKPGSKGVTTIGGVVVGKKTEEPKAPRFYHATKKQTTIAGVPVG